MNADCLCWGKEIKPTINLMNLDFCITELTGSPVSGPGEHAHPQEKLIEDAKKIAEK